MPSHASGHVRPFDNWFWWLYCRKHKVFAWLCQSPKKCTFFCAFSLNVRRIFSWQNESYGFVRLRNDQQWLNKKPRFFLSCWMECLALVSAWWPTFCVSLWAKTGSLSLMFNSAIVFDKRFCLDCDPQEGTSVANLAYMLYLWKKVGWNNKCQVWLWAYTV